MTNDAITTRLNDEYELIIIYLVAWVLSRNREAKKIIPTFNRAKEN
jgi:hypothetical protein